MKLIKPRIDAEVKLPVSGSASQALANAGLGACLALDWFERAPGFVAFLAGPQFVTVHANQAFARLMGRDVPPGSALVEAAIGGVKAQATITVVPAVGAGTSILAGTITLPAGARIGPAALQI